MSDNTDTQRDSNDNTYIDRVFPNSLPLTVSRDRPHNNYTINRRR